MLDKTFLSFESFFTKGGETKLKIKMIGLTAITVMAFLLMSGSAFAVYPHGSFATSPDACAACHRMHTATSNNLIADPNGGSMCESCHKGGVGADTDVDSGSYIAAGEAGATGHIWGTEGQALLGGGFTKINNADAATSKHITGSALTPPGSTTGATITLRCIDCHSPHPDKTYADQYRLLRAKPNNVTVAREVLWNGPWTSAGQTAYAADGYRAYTETDLDSGTAGTQYYTNNYKSGLAGWCSACHTQYTTRGGEFGADVYDAGDKYGEVGRFRHGVNVKLANATPDQANDITYDLVSDLPLEDPTGNGRSNDDKLTCLSCHRAHGTDAVMNGEAQLSQADRQFGGSTVLPYGEDSMLIRQDDRVMCVNCHNM